MPNLLNGSQVGFEPVLSRLRVRRSTTELPRSINVNDTAVECVQIIKHVLIDCHLSDSYFIDR